MGEFPEAQPSDGVAAHFLARSEAHGGGVFPVHEHDYFEVLLILSGQRVQHHAATEIDARAGSLLFIAPGVRHGATILEPTASLSVQFDLRFLHPELSAEAVRNWTHPKTLASAPELLPFLVQQEMRFQLDSRQTARLKDMWTALIARSGNPAIGAAQYARAQLSIMLLEVAQVFEAELMEIADLYDQAGVSDGIDELRSYITANLGNRFSIQDAARHLGISPSCLAARIKRVVGQTFTEMVLDARLQRARELLLYTDHRISQVAFDCGFEDHAHFSRRFRREHGVTPLEYRRRQGMSPMLATQLNIARSVTNH